MELLVRAHECHTLACNMEGIATVLRNGRVLTSALAESGDYMLMVITRQLTTSKVFCLLSCCKQEVPW